MYDVHRPGIELLSPGQVELIVEEAYRVLEEVGIRVENPEALELLSQTGARVSDDRQRAFIPHDACLRSLAAVPASFTLHDRRGDAGLVIGGDEVHFAPGSAATLVYDFEHRAPRKPVTGDLVDFAALTNTMDQLDIQSTCVVPDDVPESVADRYRLFLALAYGDKPIITGTFSHDAFKTMLAFLTVVRGSAEALREKPLAVFDCCPSSPLMWSDLTSLVLIECARQGVPANVVPAPLIGATSPVTPAGTLVQHTAETLSGIVLHQAACPGSPLGYGGAATLFDMRRGTAPMSAVEATMVDVAYAQIGKFLGLPVHSYLGLSDAKTPDIQAGFETTLGTVLAALAGVNMASGAGMLNYTNCQSLEKLVIDNEICAQARRLIGGLLMRPGNLGIDVIAECTPTGSFLTSEHTRRNFRKEVHYPDTVIDRSSQGDWEAAGGSSAADRAHDRVGRILAEREDSLLEDSKLQELTDLMTADAAAAGMETLPRWRRT